MRFLKIAALVGFILLVVGICSYKGTPKDPVQFVKSGYLDIDRGISVGEAFDNYRCFKKVTWKSFKEKNGRTLVEATGKLNLEALDTGSMFKEQGINDISLVVRFSVIRLSSRVSAPPPPRLWTELDGNRVQLRG